MEVGGWGGRNCAQCSMRSDDQKAHIQESMCASVTCAPSGGRSRGGLEDRGNVPCVYTRVSVCVFAEEYFDECVKSNMATITLNVNFLTFHA